MLKKAITYTDYNGEQQTEDFYFNLTKAELVELEMSHEGGLSESLKAIVASKDGKRIMEEFKEIILKSYGQRSPDGRRFTKTQQLRDEFESTEAYSELFMSIVTDPEAAADFVRGIMPGDLMEQAQLKLEAEGDDEEEEMGSAAEPEEGQPEPYEAKDPQIISYTEWKAMDAAQQAVGINSGDLKIRITEGDMLTMTQQEFFEGMKNGHFVVDDPGPH